MVFPRPLLRYLVNRQLTRQAIAADLVTAPTQQNLCHFVAFVVFNYQYPKRPMFPPLGAMAVEYGKKLSQNPPQNTPRVRVYLLSSMLLYIRVAIIHNLHEKW